MGISEKVCVCVGSLTLQVPRVEISIFIKTLFILERVTYGILSELHRQDAYGNIFLTLDFM
jgi:hypothetical protein